MKRSEYIDDHISFIIVCFLLLLIQSLLLYFLGNNISMIIILNIIWLMIFTLYFGMDYHKKYKRFQQILMMEDKLDRKYLLHEILPHGANHEETFYKRLLYIGNKAMLEQISQARRDRREYQEYIEQWVHEIKTPIAAMKLWSDNQQVTRKRDFLQQMERTEHYVEQALYYARSENVEKDFHIHHVNIAQCIEESVLKNKYLCMQSQVRVNVPKDSCIVLTDEKWVTFILHQLIENAIKYRRVHDASIVLSLEERAGHTYIHVRDNGLGISSQDISRVFEKGFTGENGRMSNQHSTGIGLYLCKRLCDALSVDIQIESQVGCYTDVMIIFP